MFLTQDWNSHFCHNSRICQEQLIRSSSNLVECNFTPIDKIKDTGNRSVPSLYRHTLTCPKFHLNSHYSKNIKIPVPTRPHTHKLQTIPAPNTSNSLKINHHPLEHTHNAHICSFIKITLLSRPTRNHKLPLWVSNTQRSLRLDSKVVIHYYSNFHAQFFVGARKPLNWGYPTWVKDISRTTHLTLPRPP